MYYNRYVFQDPWEKSDAICKFLADNEDPFEFMKQLEGTTGGRYDGIPSDFSKVLVSASDGMKNCVSGREKEIACLPIEDTVWFVQHMDTFGPGNLHVLYYELLLQVNQGTDH